MNVENTLLRRENEWFREECRRLGLDPVPAILEATDDDSESTDPDMPGLVDQNPDLQVQRLNPADRARRPRPPQIPAGWTPREPRRARQPAPLTIRSSFFIASYKQMNLILTSLWIRTDGAKMLVYMLSASPGICFCAIATKSHDTGRIWLAF